MLWADGADGAEKQASKLREALAARLLVGQCHASSESLLGSSRPSVPRGFVEKEAISVSTWS